MMRRRVGFALVIATLAACVGWGGPQPAPSAAERQRQFQRDEDLIDILVDSAIELSAEDDPLKRAAQCSRLADSLAREIRQAGTDRDAGRVAQLGPHLRAVLAQGVAANLTEARGLIAAGSVRERKLLQFSKLARQMEEDLDRAPNTDPQAMKPAIAAVRQGRAEIEKAIHGGTGERK